MTPLDTTDVQPMPGIAPTSDESNEHFNSLKECVEDLYKRCEQLNAIVEGVAGTLARETKRMNQLSHEWEFESKQQRTMYELIDVESEQAEFDKFIATIPADCGKSYEAPPASTEEEFQSTSIEPPRSNDGLYQSSNDTATTPVAATSRTRPSDWG